MRRMIVKNDIMLIVTNLTRICPAYTRVLGQECSDHTHITDGLGTATGKSRGAQTGRNHERKTDSWQKAVPR